MTVVSSASTVLTGAAAVNVRTREHHGVGVRIVAVPSASRITIAATSICGRIAGPVVRWASPSATVATPASLRCRLGSLLRMTGLRVTVGRFSRKPARFW